MSKWVGYAVSVNCGEPLGCYQGTILEADGTTITLTKAFRNGFPYPSQVTLNAADIKELRIIEDRREPVEQTHSTVAVTKTKQKGQRATVCENLQANPSNSGNQANASSTGNNSKVGNSRSSCGAPARSKPIDIQGNRNRNNSHSVTADCRAAGGYGYSHSHGPAATTPRGRAGPGPGPGPRRRNEAFFGDTADPALHHDFDFEGNLALFDKQALWEQMRASAPDVVRGADKFRHDENVLGGGGGRGGGGIQVPEELRGAVEYVTDEGAAVPSASPALRRRLWGGLRRCGLLECAHTLLARAAADVALRLVGGGRRLEPRNRHQAPAALVLAGPHGAGAAGVRAVRLLASHGVRALVHLPAGADVDDSCPELRRELAALRLDGGELVEELVRRPSPDLVLLALYDVLLDDDQDRYRSALKWASGARSAVVALEPPCGGWRVGVGGDSGVEVGARAAVVGTLPGALPPALGRVYLADVAVPRALLDRAGVRYTPPFGAHALLPLHPAGPAPAPQPQPQPDERRD